MWIKSDVVKFVNGSELPSAIWIYWCVNKMADSTSEINVEMMSKRKILRTLYLGDIRIVSWLFLPLGRTVNAELGECLSAAERPVDAYRPKVTKVKREKTTKSR